MKLLRKIGTGIISLGLISTFYTPDAKANLTILKWEMPSNELSGGRSYSTKIKNRLLAHKALGKLGKGIIIGRKVLVLAHVISTN